MTVFFLDNFTDSNGTNITSHSADTGAGSWVNHPTLGGGVAKINANRAYGDPIDIDTVLYYNESPPSADYRITFRSFYFSSTSIKTGAIARCSSSASTGYRLGRNNSGLFLDKLVAGVTTQLDTVLLDVELDCDFEFTVEGSNLTVYVTQVSDGLYVKHDLTTTATRTAMFAETDSSITDAGFIGITLGNSNTATRTHIDWIEGDTLTNTYTESVSNTLSFLVALNEKPEEISSSLTFGSGSVGFAILQDRQVPESVLSFVQSAEIGGTIQSRASVLDLIQSVVAELFGQPGVTSTMALTSTADVVFGVPHSAPWGLAAVSHDLGLSQSQSKSSQSSLVSTLTLTDVAVGSYGFESVLAFTQSAVGGVGRELNQTMSLTQQVSTGGSIWERNIASNLALTSNSNGWNANDKCPRRFGTRTGALALGTLTLYSKDGLSTVVLRNPANDNIRRVAFDRVLRETRGGTLIVYRDTSWNVVQTLLFTITALKRETLDQLQTFLLNTLGEEILLVDWLGEEWSGVVVKPDELFTEDREGWWTFSFEFEGSKQVGKSVFQNLGLTQSATATVV